MGPSEAGWPMEAPRPGAPHREDGASLSEKTVKGLTPTRNRAEVGA